MTVFSSSPNIDDQTPMTDITTTPTTPAEASERKLETPEQIFAAIAEDAGLSGLGDVDAPRRVFIVDPTTQKRVRVEIMSADGKPADSPFDSTATVLAIFHDTDEVRIYTAPKPNTRGFVERWTFNLVGASCTALTTGERIVDALADEYRALALAQGIVDDDDDDGSTANGVAS